jgi:Kef-type K+ transport system membrane component KefB
MPAPHGLPDAEVLLFVLFDLVVILLVARAVGLLAARLRQPVVVGEIIAGILLGPTLLGPTVFGWHHPWALLHCPAALAVAATPTKPSITACLFPPQARSFLNVFGQLALILYMFLVGVELDFGLLRGRGRGIAAVSAGAVLAPLGLAFAIGPVLYDRTFVVGFDTGSAVSRTGFILFIAAMLAVTAFPVMASILQEKGLSTSVMGSVGIASAAVVTVAMFLILAVASDVAGHRGAGTIGATFGETAGLVAGMLLVVRPALRPIGRRIEADGRLTAPTFSVLLAVAVGCGWVAQLIGVNVIVGGFLAGAVMPARAMLFREVSLRLSDVTRVLLLPVFLAFSGLNTDFTKLGLSALPGILLLLGAAIVGKWGGSAVSARLAGLSWAEGNALGVLMNCRGLLVLVVALIAFNSHAVTAPLQVGGVLMALVTTVMTAPLFDAARSRLPAPGPPLPALPPAEPSVRRVLAAVDDPHQAGGLAQAALATGGAPVEVVLACPFAPSATAEAVSFSPGADRPGARELRELTVLADFAPTGARLTPLVFATTDPAGDLLRLAVDGSVDAVVVGWRPLDRHTAGHGLIVARLAAAAPCPVVGYRLDDNEERRAGPVLLVGGATDGFAELFAGRLAAALGQEVLRVADTGPEVPAAVRRAAALVVPVTPPTPGGGLGDEVSAVLLAVASCPVYLVRPALVEQRAVSA